MAKYNVELQMPDMGNGAFKIIIGPIPSKKPIKGSKNK